MGADVRTALRRLAGTPTRFSWVFLDPPYVKETEGVLAELSGRYGLVGCVSGRRAEEARELVGVAGLGYSGNHGLELLLPGEDELRFDPAVRGHEGDAAAYVAELDPDELARAGLRVEDKGPIQALHWRGAKDEDRAESRAHEIAVEAGHAGLEPRWGRKVLELRPVGVGQPVEVDRRLGLLEDVANCRIRCEHETRA